MESTTVRVAFQGEPGAYSEEAVELFFQGRAAATPRREFQDVGDAVIRGEVDYGLLPIENSLAGSVTATYDVLASRALVVVGEVVLPIRHCLLGVPGAKLGEVRRVLSHPVALAQCMRFLSAYPSIEAIASYDTAGAAKRVAELGDRGLAAIAGQRAAARYRLVALAESIQDRPDNQTRFLVVTRAGVPRPVRGQRPERWKTACIVETENRPGALVSVLRPFGERGINLSKLESRPGPEPWTYFFVLEFEESAEAPAAREALEEAQARAVQLRVLGSYPRWISA